MDNKVLPPPEGYATWLDFAVETFDTRGVWVEQLFQDGPSADRDAMRESARSELRALRALVSVRRQTNSDSDDDQSAN